MNPYDRAASIWVEQKLSLPEGSVSEVTFADFGDGCDTCGFGGGFGLEFSMDGKSHNCEFDSGDSAGKFLEECVQILEARRVA